MTAELFTESLIKKVDEAWKRNIEETDSIYHHPTESGIVEKTIDLTLSRPMCECGKQQPKNPSDFDEKWLEAYLINEAKRHSWLLDLPGMSCRLLYSQLNFREDDDIRQPSLPQHRVLDLLLYDRDSQYVVILELKTKRLLSEAKGELDTYNRRLPESKEGLIKAFGDPSFGLEDVKGAVSYIVWPELDSDIEQAARKARDSELGCYGLIEYPKVNRPWEKVVNGEPPKIELKLVHEATPKKWN